MLEFVNKYLNIRILVISFLVIFSILSIRTAITQRTDILESNSQIVRKLDDTNVAITNLSLSVKVLKNEIALTEYIHIEESVLN